MNDPTVKFLIFAFFSALCLAAGYLARKRNVVREDLSRTIHFYTLVVLWAPVSLVSFWRLSPDRDLLILMLLQLPLTLLAWLVTALLARLFRFTRHDIGVLVLCAAMSNQGFTLGAYLCYSILKPPDLAMSYAMAFVTSMQICMVLLFYPVAQHYAHSALRDAAGGAHESSSPHSTSPTPQTPSLPHLIISSFLDIRAMPLYAALAGIILHQTGLPLPTRITQSSIMDVLFFTGAATSYFAIGLRLRLGDSRRYLRHHALLVVIKFIAMPAAAVGCYFLLPYLGLGLSPLPAKVLIVDSIVPTAIASVIVANLFHLDARMASVLWLWNTILFCVIALPFILLFVPAFS